MIQKSSKEYTITFYIYLNIIQPEKVAFLRLRAHSAVRIEKLCRRVGSSSSPNSTEKNGRRGGTGGAGMDLIATSEPQTQNPIN